MWTVTAMYPEAFSNFVAKALECQLPVSAPGVHLLGIF